MSIRLLQAIFLSGVYTAVDGATLSLDGAIEADLVSQGKAVWVLPPRATGDSVHDAAHATIGAPYSLRFPGFVRSLLASLVASTTASRTSNVVTVVATAHGITPGAYFVGFNFFYPGSPSLAAGWYGPIISIDSANITFTAVGANFGSESVNGGAIYTSLTDVASVVIPATQVVADANISVIGYRGGDTSSATKSIRMYLNGLNVNTNSVTTTPFVSFQTTAVLLDSGKAVGHGNFDNLSSVTEYMQSVPIGADTTLLVKASVSAASSFVYVLSIRALIT